jgi:hypothetical protein
MIVRYRFVEGGHNPMTAHPEWKLGLIDSAWFGSQYEGQPGREEARKIGFDSLGSGPIKFLAEQRIG